MALITPPLYAKKILMNLETAGFQGYFVGGCVRDMLMGKRPHDWDICTDALPHEVLALFPRSLPTGLKHGTVTVKMDKGKVEVTTFRSDGEYTDHRRPENVNFESDLLKDLQRRDFTMNAIALPLSGIVVDPYGGRKDIEAGIIRCVGQPKTRFEEDALRMFRAMRFSAKLGFDIEEATYAGIIQMAPSAAMLASERVRDEVEKILMSNNPAMLERVIETGLLSRFLSHEKGIGLRLKVISGIPRNKQQRWAALCAILQKEGFIASSEAFLRNLRLSGSEIRNCSQGVEIAIKHLPDGKIGWKHTLANKGIDTAMCAAAAADVLHSGENLKTLKSILKSGECFSLKRLAVSGDDLLMLGFTGTSLGNTLRILLNHVLSAPEDNERELLLDLAIKLSRNKKP